MSSIALQDQIEEPRSETQLQEPLAGYMLYAEDNISDAVFFSRCLRRISPDLQYVHQQNGMLARDFLDTRLAENKPLPRVIILDIKMPGLSGLDVLEHIRTTEELRHLPVVMLSASSEKRDVRRAARLRANAYLTKPERYGNLKGMVDAIVNFWMCLNQQPQ